MILRNLSELGICAVASSPVASLCREALVLKSMRVCFSCRLLQAPDRPILFQAEVSFYPCGGRELFPMTGFFDEPSFFFPIPGRSPGSASV